MPKGKKTIIMYKILIENIYNFVETKEPTEIYLILMDWNT